MQSIFFLGIAKIVRFFYSYVIYKKKTPTIWENYTSLWYNIICVSFWNVKLLIGLFKVFSFFCQKISYCLTSLVMHDLCLIMFEKSHDKSSMRLFVKILSIFEIWTFLFVSWNYFFPEIIKILTLWEVFRCRQLSDTIT